MKYYKFIVILFITTLTAVAQTSDCNCCSENHHQFDFWVGKWQVTNPDGATVGMNTIIKVQDGCVITENWEGAKGQYTGTSLNFYNSKTKQWEQLWIDNSGGYLKLYGSRSGNKMILKSDPFEGKEGKELINKITWTLNKDGTVRQLWEVMNKDSVVNVAFDGLYKKVN